MKHVNVGGMSESVYSLETPEMIRNEKLGDYTVLFCGPWTIDKLRKVVSFCRENRMKFVMDETVSRLRGVMRDPYKEINVGEYKKLIAEAGECFDGSLYMCEFGGMMLYWPEKVVKGSPNIISPTDCALAAKNEMMEKLRQLIANTKGTIVLPPLVCIEASGGMSKYLYEGGIDRVDLEVTYDRFTEFYYSATKGAGIAYGKERFGVDMAMVWYGGNSHDDIWFKRWQTSLYHAFIRGADPIYAEHGVMDYKALGKNLDKDAREVRLFREKLGNLAGFARKHPRPSGYPAARIAVISGNLDSFAMGQPYIWGQRGENGIRSGSPEDSWELFSTFYEKNSWEFRYTAEARDYSGNPPLGQVDVLPAESPLDAMKKYDCLIFLGWNTMTEEIYENLKKYVHGGGHLLCTLAHLNTGTKRHEKAKIIKGGDIRDLFCVAVTGEREVKAGIKFKKNPALGNYKFPLWSAVCDPKYWDENFPAAELKLDGAELIAAESDNFIDSWENMEKSPVITANRLGNGMAFLVNSFEYPGCRGLRRLYKDLLRFFSAAWQKDIFVEASDKIRFAVYPENGMNVIYLLNTDSGCSQQALVSAWENRNMSVTLEPGELKVAYCNERCLIVPSETDCRITGISIEAVKPLFSTYHDSALNTGVCFIDGNEYKL